MTQERVAFTHFALFGRAQFGHALFLGLALGRLLLLLSLCTQVRHKNRNHDDNKQTSSLFSACASLINVSSNSSRTLRNFVFVSGSGTLGEVADGMVEQR